MRPIGLLNVGVIILSLVVACSTATPAPTRTPTIPGEPSSLLPDAITPTPVSTPTPTSTPTHVPTPTPTSTPTPVPTPTPTSTPTPVPTPTPAPTPTPVPIGSERARPAPAGTSVLTDGGLAITNVNANATAAVIAANSFNDSPAAGNRFVLITVRVQIVDGSTLDETSVSQSDFKLVGGQGRIFDYSNDSCGTFPVLPDSLDFSRFQGASGAGNMCFEVPVTESDLVLFNDPLYSFTSNAAARRWLIVENPTSIEPLRNVAS